MDKYVTEEVLRSLLLLFMVSCVGTETSVDESSAVINSYPVVTTSPAAPPQPAPLMRQAVMCCGDLAFERIVGSFVTFTESLVSGDADLIAESHGALIETLEAKEHRSETLERLLQGFIALDFSSMEATRAEFGPMSDELINIIQDSSSASGQYDLAVGYSRDADHHWIQVGVEPQSPYGDGINSYSWGSREDVRSADAAREVAMGNDQFGTQN
jgi:hypothetical protein